MKILFYNYALNMGGIERTIQMLAEQFSTEHEVCFVQFTADPPFYTLPENVCRISFGFTGRENRILRTLKLARKIDKVLREQKPDVVFCMNKTHLPLFCSISRRYGCAVIGAERSNPLAHQSRRAVSLRKQSRKADGFVFQTERARLSYPEKTVEKSTVIPNAICNPDVFSAFQGTKERAFVSVGRLEKVKGYDLLISAFGKIAADLPDWRLVLYGEGVCRKELQEQADRLGLSERVVMPGADVHAFCKARACEVFVLSSRSEGMPNALLEALAAGMACVSFDCENGPRELIDHGKNGLLVPPQDVDALAFAMLQLARDGALRTSLGQEAAQMKETHSPQRIAARWLEYAQQILTKTKS